LAAARWAPACAPWTGPAIEQAGAVGFFTKNTDLEALIDRLLAIHRAVTSAVAS